MRPLPHTPSDAPHPLDLSLYLVTDTALCERAGRSVLHTVQQAVEGGVRVVQIREKHASGRAFLALVEAVARALPAHVALLVNDRIDVFLAARAAGARVAGVHIGQSEIPAALARQIIGPEAIVGLSANAPATLDEAQALGAAGVVDYVGIGPLHPTATKPDADAGKGLPALTALRARTTLPAVAIGGVTAADVPALRAAGFDGAAVVSAICAAPDACAAAQTLRAAWDAAIALRTPHVKAIAP